MNRNLLLAMALCAVALIAFTGCDSSGDKSVDYTSVRNKEAALIAKIKSTDMPEYWIGYDNLVQEFVGILDSEREAAMTYGFDSLMSLCVRTYDIYSDDSLVREFGMVEGSCVCGTVFARLYRDGDEVRLLLPGEDENYHPCRFTQAIHNVEKGKYIIVDYSRSGPDEFLSAYLYDFNGETPLFHEMACSVFRVDEPIELDAVKWDADTKTLSLPRTAVDDHIWYGEYAVYRWNGKTLEEETVF